MDTHKKEELMKLIKEQAIFVDIKEYTLSSGEKSPYYYNLKNVMFDPVGINLIADLLFEEIVPRGAKSIGGLEMGAIPITTAILQRSAEGDNFMLSGFAVRKRTKDHGLGLKVEGNLKQPVVIVDDVLTTGGSLWEAIQEIRKNGISVNHVFCIIDREKERNILRDNHCAYTSLFKHSDFKEYIDKEIDRQKRLVNTR